MRAHSTIHNPTRIGSLPEVQATVRECEVALLGWPFPFTDQRESGPFNDGFQSMTSWGPHGEGHRLYKSGLFLWKSAHWEDQPEKRGREGERLVSFIGMIWSFTELSMLLSRLYERIAPATTVFIRVKMTGCKGRALAALYEMTHLREGHISHEETISQEREMQVVELRAAHLEIAREVVKHFFHVFGWSDPADGMIVDWQQKLLNRQF